MKQTRRAKRYSRTEVDQMTSEAVTNALQGSEIEKIKKEARIEAVRHIAMQPNSNLDSRMRQRLAGAISGGYDFADQLHNVFLDYGYPQELDFFNFWNMYRRFGIARNVIETYPEFGWKENPVITFNTESVDHILGHFILKILFT